MWNVNKSIVYGARIIDKTILKNSTSGGVFSPISDLIIKNGGLVCGAVYSSDYKVKHVISASPEVRNEMRMAKYVQSNMGDIILRSSLCDYTFKNSPTLLDCHIEVLKNLVKNDEIFYTMVQGVFETNLVISDTMEELIADYFKDELCLFKKNGLSSVTLKLPKGNSMQAGFYYTIMKELSWEGINLTEVISSTNEFTVVVDNALIDKTFVVLKNIGKR